MNYQVQWSLCERWKNSAKRKRKIFVSKQTMADSYMCGCVLNSGFRMNHSHTHTNRCIAHLYEYFSWTSSFRKGQHSVDIIIAQNDIHSFHSIPFRSVESFDFVVVSCVFFLALRSSSSPTYSINVHILLAVRRECICIKFSSLARQKRNSFIFSSHILLAVFAQCLSFASAVPSYPWRECSKSP